MKHVGRGRRTRGFTLIELIVTAVIVGVLASAAIPLAELTVKRSRENDLRTGLIQIREAIDAYKRAADQSRIAKAVNETGYPKSLAQLVDGVVDEKSPGPLKTKIYFLRRLPRDPMYPDPRVPADKTWGKRSYASAPDSPSEGADVFDVYSLLEAVALNGVPYREW